MAAAYFDLALFALAVRYVDAVLAVIVAALSPLFLALVVWASSGGTGVYRKPTPGLLGLMLLALLVVLLDCHLSDLFIGLRIIGCVVLFITSYNERDRCPEYRFPFEMPEY